jgi:integrase
MTPSLSTPTEKVYFNRQHRIFFAKYKRDGLWKTKTLPVSCNTPEKAIIWFRCWKTKLETSGEEPSKQDIDLSAGKTIRAISDRWIAWKQSKSPRDSQCAQGLLDHWLLPFAIADIDLERELNLGHCTDWIEIVKASGRAPNTVRNIVQGLRGLLVDARGKGWIQLTENPLLDPYIRTLLKNTDTVAGKHTIIHLPRAQTEQLLDCKAVQIPLLRRVKNIFAISTGCRAGEIQGLSWKDIDLFCELPLVRIIRQLELPGPIHLARFKAPKKGSHRTLPLHPKTIASLAWWKEVGWKIHTGRDPKPDDPVFPNPQGDYAGICNAVFFRQDLAVAGLSVLYQGHPITFHACRRTFMTLLADQAVPHELIGTLAGHSARSVTDRYYIAKNFSRLVDAVVRLPLGQPWVPAPTIHTETLRSSKDE